MLAFSGVWAVIHMGWYTYLNHPLLSFHNRDLLDLDPLYHLLDRHCVRVYA